MIAGQTSRLYTRVLSQRAARHCCDMIHQHGVAVAKMCSVWPRDKPLAEISPSSLMVPQATGSARSEHSLVTQTLPRNRARRLEHVESRERFPSGVACVVRGRTETCSRLSSRSGTAEVGRALGHFGLCQMPIQARLCLRFSCHCLVAPARTMKYRPEVVALVVDVDRRRVVVTVDCVCVPSLGQTRPDSLYTTVIRTPHCKDLPSIVT